MRFKVSIILGSLLLSTAAYAACPEDSETAEILQLEPISSHYTKEILKRADEGLANANKFEKGVFSPFIQTFLHPIWIRMIYSSFVELIDTDLRIAQEEKNLKQHTACLNIDLLLIEAKMEQVRCELDTSITLEGVNVGKISRLIVLLRFLNERYGNLIAGFNDPSHRDTTMSMIRLFDDETTVWCAVMYAIEDEDSNTCKRMPAADCEGQGEPWPTEKACEIGLGNPAKENCPFHSDYLPPTVQGYGCDTVIMDKTAAKTATENDALKELISTRDEYIHSAEKAKEIFDKINEIANKPTPDLQDFGIGHSDNREHKEEFGCMDSEGLASTIYNFGGTKWEKRGPFSIEKDEPKIMREFLLQRANWGSNREHPDFAKLALEFESVQEQDLAKEIDESLSPLTKLFRDWWYRMPMTNRNKEQAKRESIIVAKVSDAQMQINDVFSPVRKNAKELAELSMDLDKGGRSFTRGFAWFLRRSCIFRPCNKQLDAILKIVLEDDCYPYTDGSYIGDPDLQKICKEAAKL